MLYVLPETTGDILVLQASETLTEQDYTEVFLPLYQQVAESQEGVRIALYLDPGFQGIDAISSWEQQTFATAHSTSLHYLAISGAEQWKGLTQSYATTMPQTNVSYFGALQFLQALHWINEDGEAGELYPFGG